MARLIELVFEATPETQIQMAALLMTPLEERSMLQWSSLAFCVATIGNEVTMSDRAFDMDPDEREEVGLRLGLDEEP